MTVASISEGSIFTVMGLPWPPEARSLLDQRLADGHLSLRQDADGCLTAQLKSDPKGDTVLTSARSCPVRCLASNTIILCITWSGSGFQVITVNGVVCYSAESGVEVATEYLVTQAQTPAVPARDFTPESAKAKSWRAARYAGYQQKQGRIPGGDEYIFEALGDEAAQLRDLIPRASAGELHHVRGIMSRARTLLIGTPLGLLGIAAALSDEPLTIYTAAQPGLEPPILVDAQLVFDGRPSSEGMFQNPIDLDAWLDLRGMIYQGRKYPHREVIREIGNTYASHLDMDIQPSVFFLRSGTTDVSIPMQNIAKYSIMIGDLTLHLSEYLITKRAS